jgi:hypothetical protein
VLQKLGAHVGGSTHRFCQFGLLAQGKLASKPEVNERWFTFEIFDVVGFYIPVQDALFAEVDHSADDSHGDVVDAIEINYLLVVKDLAKGFPFTVLKHCVEIVVRLKFSQ